MDPSTLSLSRCQMRLCPSPAQTLTQTPRLGAAKALSSRHSHSQSQRTGVFSQRLGEGPLSASAPSVAAPAKAPVTVVHSGNGAGAEAPEVSYVMIKPDGVQRGLVGEIISRFERKGFTLKGLKLYSCPKELAEEHYKDLSSKPFYPKLVDYIISGPVVAMAWEGKGVVLSARKLIGATNPQAAEPGTIRGDLAVDVGRNVVHGSDSVENGAREIGLWFKEGELCDWEPVTTSWLWE